MGRTLDPFTKRVLRLVAETSPVRFVDLGAYAWPMVTPPDWWLVLEDAARDLNERGYVTLTVGFYPLGGPRNQHAGGLPQTEEILRLRITRDGLLAAGFPVRRVDTQRRNAARMGHDYIPPDKTAVWVDWTRYWHHPFHATGGPIEKEPLAVHQVKYPSHRHGEWDQEEIEMKGKQTDPATIERARQLLADGTPRREVVEQTGIPLATLYDMFPANSEAGRRAAATRLAKQGRARDDNEPVQATSLRLRMLKAIATGGPFKATDALIEWMREHPVDGGGGNFGSHEVYHVLHSLNKADLITFQFQGGGVRNNGSKRSATNIRATQRGLVEAGVVQPLSTTPPARPTPVPTERHKPDGNGPVERSVLVHEHDHDYAVWKALCRACMVYHPTGQTHTGWLIATGAIPAPASEEEMMAEALVDSAMPTNQREIDAGMEPTPEVVLDSIPAHLSFPKIIDVIDLSSYPLLTALRAAEEEQEVAQRRSARLLEAAALLEADDPDESARLLARAEVVGGRQFSAIEAEYLAFVRALEV